jgi:hypothetical protein
MGIGLKWKVARQGTAERLVSVVRVTASYTLEVLNATHAEHMSGVT